MKTTLPKLLKKTQDVFNRWIRNRDKDKGCISCGGSVDHAGHYFSQGHHSILRFSEDNVNGQCIGCNTYKHGNLIMYRIGLVKRIGEERVEELERIAVEKRVYKWTREELETIIKKYK
jgi:Bacteriophage Lambda NinG protein